MFICPVLKGNAFFLSKLLASLPHGGGLMYLGFSLFHQKESIREYTVNLFDQLRGYPVSRGSKTGRQVTEW